jgi:hypothetical protein
VKIVIDIDCTAEEARSFLGLPDVAPMQAALMQTIQQRMEQALSSSDPETLMRTWLPAGMQGLETWQKMFWTAAGMGTGDAEGTTKK